MGGIYLGAVAKESYVFSTTDIFGPDPDDCAIVPVNRFCGGLLVTAKGNLLPSLKGVLNKCISGLRGMRDGVSTEHAKALMETFQAEREKDPERGRRPLPFLLLLVGHSPERSGNSDHIFIRNRVIDVLDKGGAREYVTSFDMRAPVPAADLFFGHSELSRYLFLHLSPDARESESAQVLSYLSIAETQSLDTSISRGVRMATLTKTGGFTWVDETTLQRIARKAANVEARMTERLVKYMVEKNG